MNPINPGASTAASDPNGEDRLELHAQLPPVTRVSRRAVLLVGLCGATLGLVVLMMGFGDHAAPRSGGAADESANRPTGPVESVKDLPRDYSFDVDRLPATYESLSHPSALPTTLPNRPSVQDQAVALALHDLAEQRRKLLDQQQKEQQAALDSPLLFGGTKSSAATEVPSTNPSVALAMPAAATAARLAAASAATGNNVGDADSGLAGSLNHQREAFLTQGASVEPYLSKPLLDPISKDELKAGSVIAGALVTGINTDMPGQVIGQVTENVYDSATGNDLLIPQGAKLLGRYQSLVSNGQNRALLVWQRLIYPNGASISLDGMPGTDEAGMAGVEDQVDYHLDKLAAATALSTAIAYTGNLARNPQSSSGYGGSDVIGDAVAQQANRVGEKIIDRQLDVQPTITIRPGWPFRVLVTKDMILSPYVP